MGQITTERCRRLLDHWNALPSEPDIPHTRTFLDQFDPALQPWLMMLDFHASGRTIVRLMGGRAADLWGEDLSGVDLKEVFDPRRIDLVYGDHRQLGTVPCGLTDVTYVVTAKNSRHKAETLSLPLAVDPQAPARMVFVTQFLEDQGYGLSKDEHVGVNRIADRRWLDVGFGVPDEPPRGTVHNNPAVRLTRQGGIPFSS